ncbi:MAG TPA: glycosyltransferase family 39 protein [Candidatus Saccharimonadales bacterium]|nr:glycosyltransferase family 39 protein [Candidatus Saccharimonadales bacterium]
MKILPVSEWTFYKYRFQLGYGFLALVVALYILLFSGLIPPGLSTTETQSLITSTDLKLNELPTAIVDLPYHLLQKASVELLGVTPFGVRLPSMLFGILTAIFTALVLRRWMPSNVALISSLLMLTSGWFIGTARLGAPFITIAFFSALVLLSATYISQQTKHWKRWKVVLAFTAALSLYSPFMIYLFAAAIIASFAQPHLRYLIRRSSKFHLTLGTLIFALTLVPLGWGLYRDISQIWTLVAIPQDLPGPVQFFQNLVQAASNFVNPFNISFGEFVTPLVSLAAALFLVAGIVRILRDFHAIRTYLLLIWAALLIPIMGFNPNNLTVLMIPSFIVIAIGVQPIISYWYKIFPLNPYARVFGLIPLSLLLLTVIQFNDQRYTFGMLYSESAQQTFNSDLFLAQNELSKMPEDQLVFVVVPEIDKKLYQIEASNRPNTTVVNPAEVNLQNGKWIIAESQINSVATLPAPVATSVLVNDNATEALRFRVFDR